MSAYTEIVKRLRAAGLTGMAPPPAPRPRHRTTSASARKAAATRLSRVRPNARRAAARRAYEFVALGQPFTGRDLPVPLHFRRDALHLMKRRGHVRIVADPGGNSPAVNRITAAGLNYFLNLQAKEQGA